MVNNLNDLGRNIRRVDTRKFYVENLNRPLVKWTQDVVKDAVRTAPVYRKGLLARRRSYDISTRKNELRSRVFVRSGRKAGYASFPHFGKGGLQTRHLWLYKSSDKITRSDVNLDRFADAAGDSVVDIIERSKR